MGKMSIPECKRQECAAIFAVPTVANSERSMPLFTGLAVRYLFRMYRTYFAALLIALFMAQGVGVAAGQEALLPDRATAEEAKELLRRGSTIRLFCEPCGDRYVQEIRVISVTIDEHPAENNPRWILEINGDILPPEEIYLKRDGTWRNLGRILGIADESIPETIYPFLRARKVPPRE